MKKRCVLMFSGGRDSTLAALRLAEEGFSIILVTVTSGHLIGVERVRHRLRELKRHLPIDTLWINIRQPISPIMLPIAFSDRTCLPCQQAYVLAGFKVMRDEGLNDLALGYVSYQSDWPEQTLAATFRLRELLARRSVKLHLPVYDIRTKQQALHQLATAHLTVESLEQKCTKQITNIRLEEHALALQLDLWESLVARSLDEVAMIQISYLEAHPIGEV